MKEIAFVVKVTDQCNLYCPYCYYYAGSANNLRSRKHKDLESKLGRFVERLRESRMVAEASLVMIILHGGEPLLVARDVIERFVVEAAAVLGDKARFSVQTNGVLLDEAWADMLIANDISIGFSIDGPQPYHDVYRVDARGNGTHAVTVAAFQMTKSKNEQHGLPAPGVLAVYNPEISAEAYFQHFINELGATGYDVLFPDDLDRFEDKFGLIESYRQFVADTWKIWLKNNNPRVNIRFISRALNSMHNQRCFLFDPDFQRVMVVDMQGDLFFEDNLRALVDFKDLKIGSWTEAPLDVAFEIADTIMAGVKNYPAECLGCEYFNACKGGMYSSRLDPLTKSYGLSYLCGTYKDGFAQAQKLIDRAKAKLKANALEEAV